MVDPKTVQHWITLLENMYGIFCVTPYHRNIARSLLKEPKVYFYDIARVQDERARLENLVACALLKESHFLEDVYGVRGHLHYLRTKDGVEVDFLVVINDKPIVRIEVKTSYDTPSKSLLHFMKFLGKCPCVQLVLDLRREFDSKGGIQVRNLVSYLSQFSLKDFLTI